MVWLNVVEGPDAGKKQEINGQSMVIGRQPDCGFRLTDRGVSRTHARIEPDGEGGLVVIDAGSLNGVLVNGVRINGSMPLSAGDCLQMSCTRLQVVDDPVSQIAEPLCAKVSGIAKTGFAPTGAMTRSIPMTGQALRIGRDPSNEIVLDHPVISRFHAKIVTHDNRYYLQDLQSMNGTYASGVRVTGQKELLPGELVQIGGYRYVFDGATLAEYSDNDGQVRIEVRHLTKTVRMPDHRERILLEDISFTVEPCEFVAILGGSGAGKSTLMGALTGVRPATAGEILINGRDLYEEYDVFRTMIGYVPQDDIVHQELTVREVLTFSAELRMPDDTSKTEIRQVVDRVMNALELTARAEVPVRNLSGGQRKRASIGVELLTSPGILFMDEPTSGLDPGLEQTMMELLRRLADEGRTVFLVTHAMANLHLCDKVVFLTEGGRLAFYGSPDEALQYFGANSYAEIFRRMAFTRSPAEWANAYRQSHPAAPAVQTACKPKLTAVGVRPSVSTFRQWWVLTRRYGRIMAKDRRNLAILLFQPILIALLIGLVFYNTAPVFRMSQWKPADLTVTQQVISAGALDQVQQRNADETKRQFRMSICVAIMVFAAIWLGTSNAAREIVKEAPVYRRERLVTLRIMPYLCSKLTVLALICLIQTLLFLGIIDILLTLPAFWLTVAAFLALSLTSVGMGLLVSAFVSNADKAISLVPILLVPQIILSGAIVPVSAVKPEPLRYVFDLAVAKWGYELVGGGILDINRRVALADKLSSLEGHFNAHWWVIAAFAVILFGLCAVAMLDKDRQPESM